MSLTPYVIQADGDPNKQLNLYNGQIQFETPEGGSSLLGKRQKSSRVTIRNRKYDQVNYYQEQPETAQEGSAM